MVEGDHSLVGVSGPSAPLCALDKKISSVREQVPVPRADNPSTPPVGNIESD